MYRVLILLTALLVNAGIHAVKIQIDKPEWPLNYKVVFILFSKLNLIMNYSLTNDKVARSYKIISYRHVYVTRPTVGWYVDTEGQRMRLDSYGIPKGLCGTKLNSLQIRNIVVNTKYM